MFIPVPIILGLVMGIVSLIGLFMSSRAHDPAFYYAGLALFAVGVLVIFALIKRYVGR